MKRLKINCHQRKLGSLVLSSRYKINYIKTCSFLHAHFSETMIAVENVLRKAYGEKFNYSKDIMLQVHIGIASMRQFQCAPTT